MYRALVKAGEVSQGEDRIRSPTLTLIALILENLGGSEDGLHSGDHCGHSQLPFLRREDELLLHVAI